MKRAAVEGVGCKGGEEQEAGGATAGRVKQIGQLRGGRRAEVAVVSVRVAGRLKYAAPAG